MQDQEKPWASTRPQSLQPQSTQVWSRGLDWIGYVFLAERERWLLWIPPLFGIGAAAYLSAPAEPPVPSLFAGGLIALLCAWAGFRRRRLLPALIIGVIAALLGFVSVSVKGKWVEAPVIKKAAVLSGLSGWVLSREVMKDGIRVILSDVSARGLAGEDTPLRIRVKLRRDDSAVRVGDWVSLTAKVSPPPIPSYPGAYDFARAAWFRQIGGVGFAFTKVQPFPSPREATYVEVFWDVIETGRVAIANLYARAAALGLWRHDATGGVATALVIGDRGGVPDEVREDLRVSGLAHLLAISGLHIGLAAGVVFVAMRSLFAIFPAIALNFPIKKWAALFAVFAALVYLLLSGGTVPTQRAFVMVSLVMLAIVLDRRAVSMRLVAVAAAVVLVISPENALSAGFQMSFAAVAALVAVFEKGDPVRLGLADRDGPLSALGEGTRRILIYLGVLSLTTVVATAATGPFALYHFGRIANFGLLANLMAVPVMAFWVMPFALVSVVLTPIGLGELPAVAMGWGIEAILWVAATIAAWPGAATEVGAMPDWGILLATIGGLWILLWQKKWRWLGTPILLVGVLSPFTESPPSIVLTENGRLSGVQWNGGLWLSSLSRERFSAKVWSEKTALPIAGDWKALTKQENTPMRCDPFGCVLAMPGRRIAFSEAPRGLLEDCKLAETVLAQDRAKKTACTVKHFVGPIERYKSGARAIWISSDGRIAREETVAERRGARPWTER